MRIVHVALLILGCAGSVIPHVSNERASSENLEEVRDTARPEARDHVSVDDATNEGTDDTRTARVPEVAAPEPPREEETTGSASIWPTPPTEEEIRAAMHGTLVWLVGENAATSRCEAYRWTDDGRLERAIRGGTVSYHVGVRGNALHFMGPTTITRRERRVTGCHWYVEVSRLDETTWQTLGGPCPGGARPWWYRSVDACEEVRSEWLRNP